MIKGMPEDALSSWEKALPHIDNCADWTIDTVTTTFICNECGISIFIKKKNKVYKKL